MVNHKGNPSLNLETNFLSNYRLGYLLCNTTATTNAEIYCFVFPNMIILSNKNLLQCHCCTIGFANFSFEFFVCSLWMLLCLRTVFICALFLFVALSSVIPKLSSNNLPFFGPSPHSVLFFNTFL